MLVINETYKHFYHIIATFIQNKEQRARNKKKKKTEHKLQQNTKEKRIKEEKTITNL